VECFPRLLLIGLLGSFVVLTVHNLFDNLLVHGMQIQVGFLLGLAAISSTVTDPSAPDQTARGEMAVRS
jgi:hypothetical protein